MNVSAKLEILHKIWTPHSGQIDIGKALIADGFKDVFIQAGRNFGKTELVSYLLWRWAVEHPGSENYYFAPYAKQAREILWASQRIQNFGPKEWVKTNSTEMRATFKDTGSFIKLDGSDNFEAYRGIKPRGIIIYDEFKDFRPEFHEAFDPNRAAHQAPLVIIGTPPDRDGQFTVTAEEYASNPSKKFFKKPSRDNPYLDKKWLDDKRQTYIDRGEYEIWQREYEAEFVKGGAAKIFPMLSKDIIKPHKEVINELIPQRKKLDWLIWCDPATSSCFAILVMAYNRFTKQLYAVDEIYEQRQGEMTTSRIGKRIQELKKEYEEIFPIDDWRQGYDEAAAWFCAEMLDTFGEHFEATSKVTWAKDYGLTLIKDIILAKKLILSDRTEKLYWEMDNYYKDRNGRIPKENDHLIDDLRYILGALSYEHKEDDEPVLSMDKKDRIPPRGAA